MKIQPPPVGLRVDACRQRQARLKERLQARGLDAALVTDTRHVHYLAGYWCTMPVAPAFRPALYLPVEGTSVLSVAVAPESEVCSDEVAVYESARLCTMVDDQPGAALAPLLAAARSHARIGCDEPNRPWLLEGTEPVDLGPALLALRRHKDPDEVELLRHAVRATEAAYVRARELLAPGRNEVELFAELQAAAVCAAGEAIGSFGNDFQSNAPGGPPRQREVQAGELAVFDLGVEVRGYRSDLCRTFAVNGEPTDAQRDANQRVIDALAFVEKTVRPGVRCRTLFDDVKTMLEDNGRGWTFFHHLGHGIGLSAHEAPRLNPNWDDTFDAGDVFTAEPGLYGEPLHAGIRLEHNYLVTETGVETLSSYPLDL